MVLLVIKSCKVVVVFLVVVGRMWFVVVEVVRGWTTALGTAVKHVVVVGEDGDGSCGREGVVNDSCGCRG